MASDKLRRAYAEVEKEGIFPSGTSVLSGNDNCFVTARFRERARKRSKRETKRAVDAGVSGYGK